MFKTNLVNERLDVFGSDTELAHLRAKLVQRLARQVMAARPHDVIHLRPPREGRMHRLFCHATQNALLPEGDAVPEAVVVDLGLQVGLPVLLRVERVEVLAQPKNKQKP